MLSIILLYIGAVIPALWGISHLFPTGSVVRGFGNISRDNKLIITMEWITEGVALIFIGLLVATVTIVDPSSVVSLTAYILSAYVLVVLAIVSLFTGFRINFLPFRMCPVIFSISAAFILFGGLSAS
jgi:hypothetical protein